MGSDAYRPHDHKGINVLFRDGKLLIWQNTFGRTDEVFVLRPWPDVRGWARRAGGPWRAAFCPVWKLAGAFSAPEFDERIPSDIQEIMARVPAQHFALLALLARVPATRELARHDLALTWLVANARLFAPRCTLREVRRALARGRRRLLRLLGFPAENRLLNLLRKVHLSSLGHVSELAQLPRLEAEDLSALSHLPRLDGDLLAAVSAPELRALRSPNLLREMASRPEPRRVGEADSATVQLWRVLQQRLMADQPMAPIGSLAELDRIHAEAWFDLNRLVRRAGPWAKAPPLPPPPPQLTVRPLLDDADLADEGAQMQHCIAHPNGKYLGQLRAGRAAAFHVDSPVVATLYVVHCGLGWHFGELNGVRNARVPAAVVRLVLEWVGV